jgi:hypothetical protein
MEMKFLVGVYFSWAKSGKTGDLCMMENGLTTQHTLKNMQNNKLVNLKLTKPTISCILRV